GTCGRNYHSASPSMPSLTRIRVSGCCIVLVALLDEFLDTRASQNGGRDGFGSIRPGGRAQQFPQPRSSNPLARSNFPMLSKAIHGSAATSGLLVVGPVITWSPPRASHGADVLQQPPPTYIANDLMCLSTGALV